MSKQVTCVKRRSAHYPPHQRISQIGGEGWRRTHSEAIAELRADYTAYHLGAVYLIIGRDGGHDYLTTEVDGANQKNLLSLPACPD